MTSLRGVLGCALATAMALLAMQAAAAEFSISPNDKVVGKLQDYVVQQGDNLADIARKFDIGYTEMVAANPGVAPWTPPVGRTLTIPSLYILPDAPRQGIVIDLGERRLYYFPPGGKTVVTYPIGIGVVGADTPLSTTKVVRKEPNPVWIPPPSIHAENPDLPDRVGPGPDNPLGDYALRLGWTNYLIHGTNKPDGVGRNVSHGCIHLYPEDIEALFKMVAVGTPVRAIDQPAAAVWMGIGLYVAVHPSKDQADQIDTEQAMTPDPPAGLREIVVAQTGDNGRGVDWNAVDQAGMQRTGLPVEVAIRAPEPMANNGGPDTTISPAPTNGPIPLDAPIQRAVPAAAASTSVPSLTPIFNTLQPPPGAVAVTPQPAADAPQDLVGSAFSPQVPVQLPTDETARLPLDPPSPGDAGPDNGPYADPNAAANAPFKNPYGSGSR